ATLSAVANTRFPYRTLSRSEAVQLFFAAPATPISLEAVIIAMAAYADRQPAEHGTRLNAIARHMLGLANGLPGARHFRQIMSVRSEEHTSELQSRENLVCRL